MRHLAHRAFALSFSLLTMGMLSHSGSASTLIADPSAQALHALEDIHYRAEWRDDPVAATLSGVHEGDSLLPDISSSARSKTLARLAQEEQALKRLDLSAAPLRERDDRDILLHTLQKERLFLTTIQPYQHQPDYALSIITNGLYGLIAHDYAPLEARMQATISRLSQTPALLHLATQQLHQVPAIFIEIAQEDLEGAIAFCRDDLPAAFASVKNTALQKEFQNYNKAAIAALQAYGLTLRHLTPQGHFALGKDTLIALLKADMIDLSPEAITHAGEKQLEADLAAFQRTAKEINPAHPEDAFLSIRQNHTNAAGLIQTVEQQLHDVQDFLLTHHIVALPSHTLPIVRETPAFEQALLTAATEWAGPFEKEQFPSYYDVTPPSPHFTPAQTKAALEDFNTPALLNITIHEALPGHFLQGLYLHAHPEWSLIRKDGNSYSTTEGWAHYSEQMMVEQGFQNKDPSLHLMQLQDALLRDCRLLVSFGMHMHGMTLAEATDIMQNRCMQSPVAAYKEARRGTADPGYFSYTLGKMMILKLCHDMQKQAGKNFSLESFHNEFLKAGLVPLHVIRRELTGKDGPLL